MSDLESVIQILTKFYESELKQIPIALSAWLSQSDPLVISICFALLLASLAFIGSLNSGDCSYIDRQWSIVPVAHTFIFTYYSNWNPRNVLMSAVAFLWGARLTYNFWRKGGYQGEEDYRWANLRQHPILGNQFVWLLFNLGFISVYQELLLGWFVVPSYYVTKVGLKTSLNILDFVASALFIGLVVLETVADQQQWRFQSEKKRQLKEQQGLEGDYKRGFITTGLFRYSRHPNFFAEQSLWVSFYIFTLAAGGPLLNWSLSGPIALILLFQENYKPIFLTTEQAIRLGLWSINYRKSRVERLKVKESVNN